MQILFMTGYTDDIIQHGIKAEELNFINKPFNDSVLIGKVLEILRS